ncbi:MAG: hypothetical protein IDH49_05335 [Gammaproteobacteria bacterium]|nr:hypothetical protein [Gammaproteobacteria bacterium]
MKKGEKVAFWASGIGLGVVLVVTTLMEQDHQQKSRQEHLSTITEQRLISSYVGPGVRIINAGLNPADLPDANSRGAAALTTYCVQCHELPNPAMHTTGEWQTILARMEEHIVIRRGGVAKVAMPSQQAWTALRDYLGRHAQKPLDPAQFKDLDTPAGKAFLTTCSQCHTAPAPSQHTAKEWPRVVVRMKYNMETAGKEIPGDDATRLIIGYLQRHAGDRIALEPVHAPQPTPVPPKPQ